MRLALVALTTLLIPNFILAAEPATVYKILGRGTTTLESETEDQVLGKGVVKNYSISVDRATLYNVRLRARNIRNVTGKIRILAGKDTANLQSLAVISVPPNTREVTSFWKRGLNLKPTYKILQIEVLSQIRFGNLRIEGQYDDPSSLPGCNNAEGLKAKTRYHKYLLDKPGVNLSQWISHSWDISLATAKKKITDRDFNLIKSMGFSHVRLNVEPFFLAPGWQTGGSSTSFKSDEFNFMVSAIRKLLDRNIAVVLAVFPTRRFASPDQSFKYAIEANDTRYLEFGEFLKVLGQKLSTAFPNDSHRLLYSWMNEPSFKNLDRFNKVQKYLLQKMREGAPDLTLVGTGNGYRYPYFIRTKKFTTDCNVIYDYHNYWPTVFTMQGADKFPFNYWKHLPYPSSPELLAPYIAELNAMGGEAATTAIGLEGYGNERWNRESQLTHMEILYDWARQYNQLVWVGEMGVYYPDQSDDRPDLNRLDTQRRYAFFQDRVHAMEAFGFAWALWDFSATFPEHFSPFTLDANGKRIPDWNYLRALGLPRN